MDRPRRVIFQHISDIVGAQNPTPNRKHHAPRTADSSESGTVSSTTNSVRTEFAMRVGAGPERERERERERKREREREVSDVLVIIVTTHITHCNNNICTM